MLLEKVIFIKHVSANYKLSFKNLNHTRLGGRLFSCIYIEKINRGTRIVYIYPPKYVKSSIARDFLRKIL